MRNEEKVYLELKLHSLNYGESNKRGITTSELADKLGMKRNLVSHYLNILVEEDLVKKTNTRPVYYYVELENKVEEKDSKRECFDKMIGSKSSLFHIIEQCKSAVLYPNGGLPILITGKSGVGKSYLARLIYEYAIEKDLIGHESPFIIFNCADYANNVELLSSKLFGYVKGAFTGANKESKGVIASADGGILFLDEVHRLSPEGQEKLFLLLDKGVYQVLGETKNYNKVNVRMICATTENINEVLIDTFKRRIPITVNLPDFKDRDISERLELIYSFYQNESKLINKKIKVSKRVINYLLSANFAGNVGELNNIIKVSCANALRKNIEEEILIDTDSIPFGKVKKGKIIEFYKNDYLKIDEENKKNLESYYNDKESVNSIRYIFKAVDNLIKNNRRLIISDNELEKQIKINVNKIDDLIYFKSYQNNESLYFTIVEKHVDEGLKFLEKSCGLRFYGNSVKIFSNVLIYFWKSEELKSELSTQVFSEILSDVKSKFYKSNIIAYKLLQYLKESFSYDFGFHQELYLTLAIFSIASEKTDNNMNAVIVAHGYSTASSIASVVNQLYGSYIFEAFDMPIDMEPHDLIKEIKNHAKNLDKEKGTIFLVDMGSLFDIYPMIKESFNGDIAVIDNITTQTALAVGSMILQGKTIIDIIDSVIKESKINYKYFQRKGKRKAIITTCASGIGSANKIKDMIKKCMVQEDEEIEIIPCDYFSLKNLGKNFDIFNKFDVELIITTLKLSIEGVETVLFSELFSRENEIKVKKILSKLFHEENVDIIMNNMIKMLTLENVISRLIILNPNIVIENVDAILTEVENQMNISFDSNIKLSLFIHIAIMIERHVLSKDEFVEEYDYSNVSIEKINILKNIFENKLADFDVKIPVYELALIIRIIEEY